MAVAVVGGRGTLRLWAWPGRRKAFAALALVALLAAGGLLSTSLQGMADGAAPQLSLPATQPGDAALYRDANGAAALVAFTLLAPHTLTDGQRQRRSVDGVALQADPRAALGLPVYVAYDASDGRLVATAHEAGTRLVDRSDVSIGTRMAGYHAHTGRWQTEARLDLTELQGPEAEAWCGMRPQGARTVDLARPGPLFPPCRMPFSQDATQPAFAATGRGWIGETDVVRFEAPGDVTVYLSSASPFPVRWQVAGPQGGLRTLDLETLDALEVGPAVPLGEDAVEWSWSRADLTGPADTHHNLTLAEADALVRDAERDNASSLLTRDPSARLVGGAHYSNRQLIYSAAGVATGLRSSWQVWYSDGVEHAAFCVHRDAPDRHYVSTGLINPGNPNPWAPGNVQASCKVPEEFQGTPLPPGQRMPSLASIEAAWPAYFGDPEVGLGYVPGTNWHTGSEAGAPTLHVQRCRSGAGASLCETMVVDGEGQVRSLVVNGTTTERALDWLGALAPLSALPIWKESAALGDGPEFQGAGAQSTWVTTWSVGAWITFLAAAAALVAVLWDGLRTALVPLLGRSVEDPLAHPARRALLQEVETTPGIHFRELMRRARLGRSATDHHLRKLQAAGLLVSSAGPGFLCFFRAGRHDRRETAAGPWLKSEGARRALNALMGRPQATSAELAAKLGVDPATARHHLARLQAAGLAAADADGRRTRWRATDAAQALPRGATPTPPLGADALVA